MPLKVMLPVTRKKVFWSSKLININDSLFKVLNAIGYLTKFLKICFVSLFTTFLKIQTQPSYPVKRIIQTKLHLKLFALYKGLKLLIYIL